MELRDYLITIINQELFLFILRIFNDLKNCFFDYIKLLLLCDICYVHVEISVKEGYLKRGLDDESSDVFSRQGGETRKPELGAGVMS